MQVDDHWITHPRGRLFARTWTPADGDVAPAPLVLLHDSLGCVELWRDFPAALGRATGRRVVAYDRLGFGQSDARHDKLAQDFIADEAKSFFPVVLEQLGIARFAVFGHSVGGGMAVNCAAALADRCDVLVTESAQALVEDKTVQGLLAAREQFKEPGQMERLARYHGNKAAWVLEAWLGTWLNPAFQTWCLLDPLRQVVCPTLVIHGMDDEYGSTSQAKFIRRKVAGETKLRLLADTGHVPHRERAAEVVTLVADFLDSR